MSEPSIEGPNSSTPAPKVKQQQRQQQQRSRFKTFVRQCTRTLCVATHGVVARVGLLWCLICHQGTQEF
ncbi:hypothetical protein V2A60_007094 [Cordyceps javanica]